MDQEKPAEPRDPECPVCTPDVVCAACLEAARRAGIPEHTIQWLQLSKLERIESVMF